MTQYKKGFPIVPSILLAIVFILGSFFVGFKHGDQVIGMLGGSQEVLERTNEVSSAGLVSSKIPPKEEIDMTFLWNVWDLLRKKMYVGTEIDKKEIMNGMIKGLVSGLQDDYTVFLDSSETANFHITVDGELEGIGAEISVRHGSYYIANVIKNSPAFQAGLKAEDMIVKVDDLEARDLEFQKLIESIRGPKGTKVKIFIARKTESKLQEFEITRDTIIVPSVEYSMKENSIGYVSLNQFQPETDKELKKALDDLKSQGMKKLIIDLRDNGGGYLNQAISVVSTFLPEGNVLQREYAGGKKEYIPVIGKPLLDPNIPIVILVNEYSASASEITAGTLQDYGRAKLVGVTTFGKGTVQETSEFPDGSSIKFTVSKWLTGKGNDINKKGVKPDVEVKQVEEAEGVEPVDEQLNEALKMLTI